MRNPYAQGAGGEGAPDPNLAGAVDPRVADYESAIGPNSEYYRPRFEDYDANGPHIGWHWPAFFATSAWFIYRKMWLIGVLNFVYPFVVLIALSIVMAATRKPELMLLLLVLLPGPWIVLPMYANRIYWSRIRRLIDEMPASIAHDPARRAARLEVQGGVSTGPMVAAVTVMLLVTVGIIGGIAAVSIPAYQDYTVRAQVTEGLNLAGQIKADVVEFRARTGEWPADSAAIGSEPRSGKYVSAVRVQLGSIVVDYGGGANQALQSKKLIMVPGTTDSGDVMWACGDRVEAGLAEWGPGPIGTDIPQKYLPKACRRPE